MIIPVTLLFFPFGVKPIIDMGEGSDQRQFQLLLTSFPVRHHFLKESMEIRTVIAVTASEPMVHVPTHQLPLYFNFCCVQSTLRGMPSVEYLS